MKILYLCKKETYDTKMSRVRFDGMAAIAKQADVIYAGNGWPNYDETKTVQENIHSIYGEDKPDLIVVYKPENFKGFAQVDVPTCMRYNEMWPVKEWTKEILDYKLDLIIAHHLNDIPKYDHISGVTFAHVPHSAEQTVFKDYHEDKKFDLLFTGATSRKHYPFRGRLLGIVQKHLVPVINCRVLGHPGGSLTKVRGLIGEEYAKLINQSKITITCSSAYKYRLGKYVEIPMCASMLAGDLPDQDQEEFNEFMLVLNPSDTDQEIVNKVLHYVKNDEERNEKIQKGLEWGKKYTQEKYAERFLKVVEDFLESK